jgi:hypothetical protein
MEVGNLRQVKNATLNTRTDGSDFHNFKEMVGQKKVIEHKD